MKIRNKKLLTKSIAMAIFMSSTLYTMPITHAAFNNNTLPSGGSVVAGTNVNISDPANITQGSTNAVIKWNDFSIGANATVNFNGPSTGFNTLNYVNGGNLSQIYGTINATNGNIYIVNPAGVQIGNSAQINVGSLYVSNKSMPDDKLKAFQSGAKVDTPYTIQGNRSNAELMSLGNINAANKVTFDGNRIVLDVDRVKNGQTPLNADNITIKTTQTDLDNKNVVLGYTAYDSVNKYNGKNNSEKLANLILEDNITKDITKKDGFMWVKDGEQLQAMGSNSSGNYAFHNSIDLNSINNFNSIENFKGNLDGLGYDIYGLHSTNNGLFKNTSNSTIRNFNLISGSITSDAENAGAVIGNATDTVIENVKNTINVTGTKNVGGIIGTGTNVTLNGVVNAGAIKGNSNVGGLAGSLVGDNGKQSFLTGESYNLGDIKGLDTTGTTTTTTYSSNIGGLVGSATNSIIGNKTGFQMYNHLDVTGGYNVGGIVGELKDSSTVQNVSNDGNILATGYTKGTYKYHTDNSKELTDNSGENGVAKKSVNIANVGGIVGKSDSSTDKNKINNVLNNGDISAKLDTTTNADMPYYTAGNVGGVVGSAVNTDISNATNKENDVRGAHNVGGIAGYLESGTITKAINNGGDIMATGARNGNDIVKEFIRYYSGTGGDESFIVGNIGGIVGYMYGDSAYINTSANRGTVHTEDIVDENKVLDTSKAANVGGIVGKIDRGETKTILEIKNDNSSAAINSSYNTGNVRGYTGVGGVAGMMYNGEIVGSYNIGEIRSTRKDTTSVSPLNMGGIVGDSTEETSAKISLYDVYNKGQIGDEEFVYKGRHVGGIAGRLSGDVEKSYNDGDIYNGATVTGGIAGWWVKGDITNSFNTGNITNYSTTHSANGSNVGGIAGGMGIYQTDLSSKLENVYNLGTIRSIKGASKTTNTVGGMIGTIGGSNSVGRLTIKNVYTLGNLYSVDGNIETVETNMIGSYYTGSHNVKIENAYYIDTTGNGETLSSNSGTAPKAPTKLISESESISGDLTKYGFDPKDWRIYKGTTPILNAFMPESSGYLKDEKLNNGLWSSLNISSVQYGTAYDPLLTIINAKDSKKNVVLNWTDLGIYGDGGLAVYDSGLTLNNFKNSDKGVGLFGGIIYSDGALNIKSYDSDKNNAENIGLGSFSKLYGASVNIDAGTTGTVDAYGSIISTGNNNIKGDITITGANVNTYGEIKTAVADQTTTIDGIKGSISDAYDYNIGSDLTDQNAEMSNIAEGYAHTVTAGADSKGDVSISATNGDVNIYYGNMEKGIIDTQGDVSLSGNNVYVDSDMVIGGDLTADTGENSVGEIVLDISNIGKVTNKNNAIDEMHKFLTSFSSNKFINFTGTNNAKITIDMWDYNTNTFDLDKYDLNEKTLSSKLDALNVTGNNNETGKDFVYIWVADGEQLKGIQKYATDNPSSNILSYNFALKNDINATDVIDYKSIGSNGTVFTGKFDGRENRIIGLNVDNTNSSASHTSTDNVGVFGVNAGTIKNLKVYSSTFKGYDNVGAIAGTNNGTIDNVTTLGNTVEALGSANSVSLDGTPVNSQNNVNVGAAGGVVGTNNGTVDNATSRDSVIAGKDANFGGALTTAGGIAGINIGLVSNSQSHSAVIASKTSTYSLGGIVGVNTASDKDQDGNIIKGLDNVNAYGVTGSSILVDNTGGIAGLNSGTLNDAYNESIVKGSSNVGGIAGTNSGNISLIVNGASVTAKGDYTGGLVGSTTDSISDGRNNGVITGVNYVGGLVGSNGNGVTLEDLTNDSSAEIIGKEYVGGIAGTNSGSISTTDTNLINRGSITGNKYVGGIAGENKGTIANVNNDIVLNATGSNAQYFGGVTGINKGTITNATNRGNINASEASYVGGIAGENKGTLSGAGNKGKVTGKDYVGGVAGLNTKGVIGNINSIIGIKNEGAVIAEAGGAGGIFGKNEANIQYAELSNSGTVTGTAGTTGTGGIFGENTGDIDHSSLKNEVKGNVSGVNNVGGLIGINSGTIEGDRDEASHYYKYQIYNNGTITATGNGSNIGGLIGKNTGKLTAGYNTGNIVAGGSTNVGGIVGTNEGTVDRVFNTIMTVTGESTNTINGKDNVGAIIGDNTNGTLTNAYSTNGGVSVLVGTGNSNTNDDNNTSIWKTYTKDGNKYKVLKVFLTSVKYDPSQKPDLVYNGEDQKLNVNANANETDSVLNSAFEDLSGKQFLAQKNTGNNLIGSNGYKNAGTYTDWLYSGQIASSGKGETFNPNNLGYDIDLATGIKKAQIDITLNDIERIYGSLDIINNGGYGFTYNNDNLTPAMIKELKSLGFSVDSDSALVGDKTKDVGSYTWTGIVTLGSLSSNYELKNDNDGDGSITSTAISKVTPKTLTLKDLLATIVYGNQDNKGLILQKPNNNTDILNGIVYGDDVNINLGNITLDYKNDSAYDQNRDNRVTADVGIYGNSLVVGNISLTNNEKGNYKLDTTTTGGSIQVTPADLVIDLGDVEHTYGTPNLNDYGVSSVTGLTNGDKANIGVTMTKDDALKDKEHTNDAGDYTWTGSVSGIEGLENNYNIKVNDGQSVVNKADLTIDLNENVHHEYGKPNLDDYVITGTDGLTNGDEAFEDKLDVTMTHDDALTDNNTHTKPAGGDYTWTGSVDGIEGLEDNYNITINPGKSTVDKGHLTITVDDSNTTVGDNPSYGGTVDGWANGDNPDDFDISFGVDDDTVLDQPGKHDGVIGVIIGDKFYPSGTEDDIFNNYDVTINTGDLTVLKPFDIDDSKNWSHLYKDAPWDRNRDFKERKAEFNFVDGAIPLDEAVEEV